MSVFLLTYIARRFLGLVVAIGSLMAMWTFASKPLVWEWMGRPNDFYPEWAFFAYGLPASLLAIASGGWIVWKTRASANPSRSLPIARVTSVMALAICAWLSWFALSAFLNRP